MCCIIIGAEHRAEPLARRTVNDFHEAPDLRVAGIPVLFDRDVPSVRQREARNVDRICMRELVVT